MKIVEFRIHMPLSLNEYLIGHEWNIKHHNQTDDKLEAEGYFEVPCDEDDCIEIGDLPEYEDLETQLKSSTDNEKDETPASFLQFSDIKQEDMSKYGKYTRIRRAIESNLPWFVQKLMPTNAKSAIEKTWDMYPYVKQVTINDYFRKSCRIEVDSITREHVWGEDEEENIHNLSEEKLKKREIVQIDITEPPSFSETNQNDDDEDPTSFKSVKTNRGPLESSFWTDEKYKNIPSVCCYKLYVLDFKIFPIQSKIENNVANTLKNSIVKDHRKIFCSLDKWLDLSLEEVRKLEDNFKKEISRVESESGSETEGSE